MKFASLFGKSLLAVALAIPSFAIAQESPPDINASAPILDDPALDPITDSAPNTGAIAQPPANSAAVELGESKPQKKKTVKKSAKKEIKKSKKAEKKSKKIAKKAKKANTKKKKKNQT